MRYLSMYVVCPTCDSHIPIPDRQKFFHPHADGSEYGPFCSADCCEYDADETGEVARPPMYHERGAS